MEDYNKKIDNILRTKMQEIENVLSSKTKPKKVTNHTDINYNVKTTIYKIEAEQERKFKTSKAYKTIQNSEYEQAIHDIKKENDV